jgi:hypothetical protein|tara:strand:- start:373 stop:804 length:432 start_codon:yes stop_codon:yes gene_type:complete
MAKWINFNVVGGVTTGQGGTAAPQMDGDNLLLASSIVNVSVVETAAGAPDDGAVKATLNLSTGGGPTTATMLVATAPGAGASPNNNVPVSANYVNKVKAAIQRAMTANPGGVKASATLPQDTASATASYDPALKVYWRSFTVA